MAYGLRQDSGARTALAGRMRALSAPLRVRLVEALAARPVAEEVATALLQRPIRDPDQTVQIVAAAAFARRHKSGGTVDDSVVSVFTEHLRSRTFEHEGARAAGFCALAELGRLDILADMTEPHAPEEPLTIEHSYAADSSLLYRYVCRFWGEVKATLGDDFARRFHSPTSSDNEVWQQILLVAHDYPAAHPDLNALLAGRPVLAATAAGVNFMWRSQSVPSQALWTATQSVLRTSRALSYHEVQPVWTALHVLTEAFPDHPRTQAWLNALISECRTRQEGAESAFEFLPAHGEVAALARLRPDHAITASLRKATSPHRDRSTWAQFLAWTELSAGSSSGSQEFTDVALEITRIIARNDEFPDYIHQPLTARLRRDSDLAAQVAALVHTLPAFSQGTLARLLAMSGHLTSPLIEHLRQTSGQSTPLEATFDPMTGKIVTLQQLALDLLDTAGRQQPA
jgi:hypothetical protein